MASSSSSTSVIIVVLLLFPVLLAAAEAPAPTPSASANIILAACKTVGGGSTYFDVMFCVDALGSVGGAADALNYQDLATVAMDLLATNATSTKAKIDRLLGDSGKIMPEDAVLARCLRSCQSLYSGIVDGGPACTAAVQGGRFGEAASILEKAAAAAKECEDGFGKSNAASPLTTEDDHAFKLAKLAVATLAPVPLYLPLFERGDQGGFRSSPVSGVRGRVAINLDA